MTLVVDARNQTPDQPPNRRKSRPRQASGRADPGQAAQQQSEVTAGRLDEHARPDILMAAHPHAAQTPGLVLVREAAALPAPLAVVGDDDLGLHEFGGSTSVRNSARDRLTGADGPRPVAALSANIRKQYRIVRDAVGGVTSFLGPCARGDLARQRGPAVCVGRLGA